MTVGQLPWLQGIRLGRNPHQKSAITRKFISQDIFRRQPLFCEIQNTTIGQIGSQTFGGYAVECTVTKICSQY
ncbi:hypothetical protein Xbed_01950 [Xenorhabdus beddingii]|uniref:Uncharacterized protein n=1 Tax=Xenorhabdus beddingii TaxID=40578 RepID=A0A1Y2SLP8_9GAMM|nr:hypothetical protein Xbed_01950 [Xenorhabdus beddingii]